MYTFAVGLLANIYLLALYAFALLGLLVALNYLYENLRSPVLILKELTLTVFRGDEYRSLVRRFGKWAGKNMWPRFIFRSRWIAKTINA